MRANPKSLFSIALCLLLGIAGQTMTVVRGVAATTDQIVICAGSQTRVVYLDASGEPTTAPHVCPDCLISWYAATRDRKAGAFGVPRELRTTQPRGDIFVHSNAARGFESRAPPVIV